MTKMAKKHTYSVHLKKPEPKLTVKFKNFSLCVCVSRCTTLSYTTEHGTVLMIYPLIFRTIVRPIAQTLSTEGQELIFCSKIFRFILHI